MTSPQNRPGVELTPSPVLTLASITRRLWDHLTPAERLMVKQIMDDRGTIKPDGEVDWDYYDASLHNFEIIQQAING